MLKTWDVYLGSETGIFKGVNTEKNEFCNFNNVTETNRENEITSLCWSDSLEEKIYLGQKNQVVKVFDCNTSVFIKQLNLSVGDGVLRGILPFHGNILTATDTGYIHLWNKNEESEFEINAGQNLYRMRQHPSHLERIATGGEENDLKIWDLNSRQSIFKAKNVRNDFLDLRVPVWITDMQFIPDSDKLITCTRHHQVRLYDPSSSQRRPVINMEFETYPLMSLSIAHREHQIIVGSSRGRMALLDLRKKSLVHVFKGFAGSIRYVHCHPTLPFVASCGLDRFLRIHELNTHKLLKKIYLKARLNCLLTKSNFMATPISDEPSKATETKTASITAISENGDNDDELWHNMKTIQERFKKSKRSLSDKTVQLTGLKKKRKMGTLQNR